jgi:hypothetical protein
MSARTCRLPGGSDGGPLLDNVSGVAALPAPVVGSVAAVPPWGAALAAGAIAASAFRLRRVRSGC